MKLTLKQKWNAYLGLSKRNILKFFKNKATLIFSMLAPIIVFMLYVVFLKDTYLSSLKSDLSEYESLFDFKDLENLSNAWLLSGVIGTSCVTVALNSLHVMVHDKENKVDFDFNSSPISGPIVVLAYFTGAFINTFIITGGILTVGIIVLSAIGNMYLGAMDVFMMYVVTIIGSASATIIMMIICSFFKKGSSLGSFTGIVSAAIGFVIGAYIPLGTFAEGVQGVLALVPGSHVAALYRNLMMSGIMDHINSTINGLDNGAIVNEINQVFALNLNLFSYEVKEWFMYLYSCGSIVLALLANIVLYRKSSKRV